MVRISNNYRYFVPAAITAVTLWSGILAIVLSTQGLYHLATFAILFSVIADNLDGRVARFLDATSSFGKELDSLADMVAFGVAPSVLVILAIQINLPYWAWGSGIFYVSCTAARLAHFNTDDKQSQFFCGLPSPAAAATIACGVLYFSVDNRSSVVSSVDKHSAISLCMLALLTGLLMISPVRFLTLKALSKRSYIFLGLSLILLVVGAYAVSSTVLFIGGVLAIYSVASLISAFGIDGIRVPVAWLIIFIGFIAIFTYYFFQ